MSAATTSVRERIEIQERLEQVRADWGAEERARRQRKADTYQHALMRLLMANASSTPCQAAA